METSKIKSTFSNTMIWFGLKNGQTEWFGFGLQFDINFGWLKPN